MFIMLGQRLERSNTNGGDWGQMLNISDIRGRDFKATSRRTCTESGQRFMMFNINGIDSIKIMSKHITTTYIYKGRRADL